MGSKKIYSLVGNVRNYTLFGIIICLFLISGLSYEIGKRKNSLTKTEIEYIRNTLLSNKKEKAPQRSLPAAAPDNLAKITERVSKTENSLSRLKDYIKAISEENNLLKTRQEQLNISLSEKDAKLLDVTKLNDGLNARLAELTSEKAYLSKQVSQIEENVVSLKIELNKANEQVTHISDLNSALESKVSELTDALNSKDAERLNISRELEELKNKTSQLSGLLKQRESELNNSRGEVSILKENLDKSEKKREPLALTLKEKEGTILKLNATLKQMEYKLTETLSKLDAANEQQKKISEQLAQAAAINTSLQKKILDISK